MGYTDEDIEFANLILTDRGNLDDAKVEVWMKDPEHVMLLKEFATVYQKRMNIDFNRDKKEEFARLENTIQERKSRRMTLRWSVAASVILFIGLFVGRMVNEWRNLDEMRMLAETERIVPGVKAELILSTGERVVLNQQCVSIEGVNETGIQNDSVTGLNYTTAKVQGEGMIYNTMRIPVGGFYQLALSDGSKVWLNSMTEFRFPVAFTGEERKVYLTGEAYFEVAPNSKHPFIVVTEEGMEVKVYGTEFNMNTYQHGGVQTVLVSGKVGIRVNATGKEVMLAPRQMAEYSEKTGMVRVEDTDPYRYIAWKDGEFVFERETIEEIMERLGRWYDVKVFYENESLKQKRFTGVISRYEDIEQVLRLIEGPATLRFEVKGNVVTVKYGQ
ncbi:FecR family protein [Butyricimonas virosa]|jgi:transmembrane sensor|uniref:FecR family protein n=1 Tax=Butyricimonas virosa TaxID=544645 RepID=A0A413IPT9_9BACT|nr:FecR family protein [Butyricimonas virosa]RGL86735.1 FecR family protein [Butyricimonas virosa]RGY19050.1 FecR family protein [Butyricimonas virosa]RHI20770.1 FecR family protein [Butyricimonas virosa]